MVWSEVLLLVTALLPVPDPGWQWPLRPPPQILRVFAPPAHPWEAGHRGVDLAATPGQAVYATGPGRVGFARDLAGRGVVTVIHGLLRTTYLPVRPSVRPGQVVRAGARIGVIENVLGHCGQTPCLHWGLRQGVTYLDPLTLLGHGPVRLLPWWDEDPMISTEPPVPSPDTAAAWP
jgi:murein DD-endopeptidase MepM/ murein hydrolase activator NlpD